MTHCHTFSSCLSHQLVPDSMPPAAFLGPSCCRWLSPVPPKLLGKGKGFCRGVGGLEEGGFSHIQIPQRTLERSPELLLTTPGFLELITHFSSF